MGDSHPEFILGDYMLVLVTGATGYIGRKLVDLLLAEGHRVRCLVRRADQAAQLPAEVEVVAGDVLRRDTLAESLRGVECAYYLVHSMRAGESGFAQRDRLAAYNFATEAKAASVRRVVYLGGLGSGVMSAHLKSRQETGQVLRRFGPPLVEFRAGIIVGAGSASFEIIRSLAEKLPVMICPRWVTTRVQPIAVSDVLQYLIAALSAENVDGEVIEIGGSKIESYRSMIQEYARLRGLRRRLIRVPVLTPRLSSYWLDFVTSVPPSITRPLIEGLKTEVVCANDKAQRLFHQIKPSSYLDALQTAIDRQDPGYFAEAFAAGTNAAFRSNDGILSDCRRMVVAAPVDTVRDLLHSIGGGMGWLYADPLWRLRGWLDRLFGGVGMRRRRIRLIPLQARDELDFWRVQEASENRLLLRAEMKVPGEAWLQFRFVPLADGRTELRNIASFEPRGLLGRLYWWSLYPLHLLIFRGMLRAIAKLAEARACDSGKIAAAEPPYDTVFRLVAETGIRRGELCALNVGHVDVQDCILIVRKSGSGKYITDTKSRRPRVFSISRGLAKRLKSFVEDRDPDEPLFLSAEGKRLHLDNFVKRKLKPIVEALGLEGACTRSGMATLPRRTD